MPRTIDERTILSNFLLPPATLSSFLSEQQFRELFPPNLRSHPQVEVLYRDLQRQRVRIIEAVSEEIEGECQQGVTLARQVAHKRARSERAEMEVVDPLELRMEMDLSGTHAGELPGELHSLHSIIPALKQACEELDNDNKQLEQDAAQFLEVLTSKVETLSDLRYGRFKKTASGDEDDAGRATIESLDKLREACDSMK